MLAAIFFLVLYIVIDSWFAVNQLFGKCSMGIPLYLLRVINMCGLVAPDMNLFNRLALLHIVCFGARSSYYYAWLISKQLFTRKLLYTPCS